MPASLAMMATGKRAKTATSARSSMTTVTKRPSVQTLRAVSSAPVNSALTDRAAIVSTSTNAKTKSTSAHSAKNRASTPTEVTNAIANQDMSEPTME